MKIILILSLLAAPALCADTNSLPISRISRTYQENLARYKDNPNMLVRPGLVADRTAKSVLVEARTTTISLSDPVEFFLVGEKSGHDYEAIAVSFAEPSDIHKGLAFIGMTPGRTVDASKLQFWPKGERVFMSLIFDENKSFRVEELVRNSRTEKTMPLTGLIFAGSSVVDSKQQPGTKLYSADVFDPHSIASAYNEPGTVLDVPYQAAQQDMYNQQYLDPESAIPTNRFVTIRLEPEYTDGRKRIVDLSLTANAGEKKDELLFLLAAAGRRLYQGAALTNVLSVMTTCVDEGRDTFVTLRFGDNLSLLAIRQLCTILAAIETENGIRIEPPVPGQLYYRAFLPNRRFRDRSKRIAQPWELHIVSSNSLTRTTLVQIRENWDTDNIQPDLETTDHDIAGPDVLRATLDRLGPGLPVILVFADPAITHSHLMRLLDPVLSTHPTIHVFLEPSG